MWKFGYDINSTTKWIAFALTLLFASNVAFITAFVTTSWGQLTGLAADNSSAVEVHWWRCGLWQCCRDDGFCLGTRWPAFYSAARAFAVLGLFVQVAVFCLMVGHTLEKFVDRDRCTMVGLVSLSFVAALFIAISVICFGLHWPTVYRHEFDTTQASLSYGFYLAVGCVPVTLLAGVMAANDLRITIMKRALAQPFAEFDVIGAAEGRLDSNDDGGQSSHRSYSIYYTI